MKIKQVMIAIGAAVLGLVFVIGVLTPFADGQTKTPKVHTKGKSGPSTPMRRRHYINTTPIYTPVNFVIEPVGNTSPSWMGTTLKIEQSVQIGAKQ